VDWFGSDSMKKADLQRSIQNAEAEKRIRGMIEGVTGPLGQSEDASIGERVGRLGAQAAPQLALATATGGASLPVQSLLGGVSSGAESLAEGASPERAAVSAGFGALAPGEARLAGRVAKGLGKAAVNQYAKALNPTTRALKAESDRIIPELLDRGVTGDLQSLAARGTQESSRAGSALASEYQQAAQAGTTMNATQIADSLDGLKAPFIGQSGAGQPVVLNQNAVGAIESLQNTLRELGDTVAPDQLWKFRQNVDDLVKSFSGQSKRGSLDSIAKKARSSIQNELAAAVPDVKRLNAEYSLWQALEKVAKATAERKVGQQGSAGWLARSVGGVIGGVAGVATGGGSMGAAGGAIAGQQVTKMLSDVMTSPAWRTASAVQKKKLADFLANGQTQRAIDYLIRIGGSGVSGSPRESQR